MDARALIVVGRGPHAERLRELLAAPASEMVGTKDAALVAGVTPQTLRLWACRKPAGRPVPRGKIGNANAYVLGDLRAFRGIPEPGEAEPVAA